ncbi:MAG: PHP domain-containing protein [Ktedonobacteraceae bacterium]|nr:PHP domain-containing protein [Ktedonobacteraceae bacterium]
MHTAYSDGRWPAQQLIDYLAEQEFDLVAVTDHDRVDKVAEIQALGAEKGLSVLSGVEMSTEWRGNPTHLLCYGFDPQQNEIGAIAAKVAQLQLENTYQVYEELRRKGYDFPRQQEILAESDGRLVRPIDNATLLREHGYAPDRNTALHMIREAGFRVIHADLGEVVEAAHRSGAVCLISHPGRRESGFTYYDIPLLDQLRAEIPLDGLEVYHPYHSQETIEMYLEYVRKHHLLLSTGSDSHSMPGRMPIKYRAEISRALLERLGVAFI